MKAGFGKNDITPRVGVELCGFGPYLCRKSTAIRDPLSARALVVEHGRTRAALISCDLIAVPLWLTQRIRERVQRETGIPADAVMLHCTHTHSGPALGPYIGWGEPDQPYIETLPQRVAKAVSLAASSLRDATVLHAEVPCAGIGLNREFDRDAQPLDDVLREDWRPARPELTDTTCHVLRVDVDGRTAGVLSYFGCHPVVCCQETHYIHGDYCGVACSALEREHPGSAFMFLQGANGDVNSCVVHKPEQASLLALDVIAGRFARAVRSGMAACKAVTVDEVRCIRRAVTLARRPWGLEKLRQMLSEKEAILAQPHATDALPGQPSNIRMEVVYAVALRRMIAQAEGGEPNAPVELQGLRLGCVALLGAPFEIMQAIKNDIRAAARSQVPLVMSVTNDTLGYAPDRTCAARGGYAADVVPLMGGFVPFANLHDDLVRELSALEVALTS